VVENDEQKEEDGGAGTRNGSQVRDLGPVRCMLTSEA
jgi:hypothetical protein